MIRSALIALLSLSTFAATTAAAQTNNVNVYIYGNSLVHHQTDSDETTVPHWLHHLAKSANKEFFVNGHWGFLRTFATDLPPSATWGFKQAKSTWDSESVPFSRSKFNNIIITPANFIQYQSAATPYEGDNPDNQSPLSATLKVIDWTNSQRPGLTYYIYEGWTEMAAFSSSFPPSSRGYRKFHAYNVGTTRAWFVDFIKMIKAKRPDINVQLMPIGSTLSRMLTQTPLKSLKPEIMFSDSAPHGTANTYFLVSLVAYATLYGEAAPKDFPVPGNLAPEIAKNYKTLVDLACQEVAKVTKCKSAGS